MKLFILRISTFLILIFIICFALDLALSKKLKTSKTHAFREYSTWNDLFEGKINADIIINGSSRAWRHINPAILKDSLQMNAYNLGMDGQQFPMQYLRYQSYLSHHSNIGPRIIIHSLDLFMFQKSKEIFNPDQFLPYMLFNSELEKMLATYQEFNYWDFKIPFLRYYGRSKAFNHLLRITLFPKTNKDGRINGFAGADKAWNNDLKNVKDKMSYFKVTMDTGIINQFKAYLKNSIQGNSKVFLVYSPEYIEGQNFVVNRSTIISTFKTISNELNIPFLDYSNDTLSYHTTYFYNSLHLNAMGAEIFSKRLSHDLKTIISKDALTNKN